MAGAALPVVVLRANDVADVELAFAEPVAGHALLYSPVLQAKDPGLLHCELKEVAVSLLSSCETHLWLQLKPAPHPC